MRANFTWILSGNVTYSACQWITLVLLAKIGNVTMLGQFALGLAINVPIFTLANLALRSVLVTDTQGRRPFRDYLGLRLFTSLLVLLGVVSFLFCSQFSATSMVIFAVSLVKAVESISDTFHGLFQQKERMDRVGKSLMLKSLLSPLAMGILLVTMRDVFWGTVAMACGWALVLFAYDIPRAMKLLSQTRDAGHTDSTLADTLKPRWNRKSMRQLTIIALPLGITVMLTTLFSNVPRYFLSEHDLGIFAGLASLTVLGTTVVTALGRASIVRFAHLFTERNTRAFRALLLRLLGFATLLVTAGILLVLLVGRPIVELLFTAEFAEHTPLLILLVASAMFEYFATLLGTAVTATREFKRLAVYYSFVAVVAVVLAFLLIPRLGLPGAAWTLIGTYSIICLVLLLILRTAWRRARGAHHP